jgi:hypothetical protein
MAKGHINRWVDIVQCIGRESNPGLAESIQVLMTSIGNGQFYH